MGSRKQTERRKRQADIQRRRQERLRDPAGWNPPAPPETAWLDAVAVAGVDEPAEDVAIFADEALAGLPPQSRAEADLVRSALRLAQTGEPHAALDILEPIGRRSSYADWRLFMRGLAAFQKGDLAGARQAWDRLAPSRRPGRIAMVLASAWETIRHAPEEAPPPTGEAPPAAAAAGPSAAALAFLGRRSMWKAAREIANIHRRREEQTFSPSQAALAIRLDKQYRSIDPDFVAAFLAACRTLAMGQPDDEPIESLLRGTTGPADDPHCTRLRFIHLGLSDASADRLEECIRRYVDRDLPGLLHLPAPLRAALASTALCEAAAIISGDRSFGPFEGRSRCDLKTAEALLREAIQAFPQNPAAHERLLDLLAKQCGPGSRKTKASRSLVAAKLAFVEQFPDRHAILVELIDGFLAAGEFSKAKPLVRLIAGQRCREPAARAAPWRFELLQVRSLAGASTGLPLVRQGLEAAIEAWPASVPRQWIAHLETALKLRAGDEPGYADGLEAARRETPHGLVADVLQFEALETMGGPPAHRERARRALVASCGEVGPDMGIAAHMAAGCFYFSLAECGLDPLRDDHPGIRLGRALIEQIGRHGTGKFGWSGRGDEGLPVGDASFWIAFRWLAEHDFFGGINPKREPRGFRDLVDSQPKAAAEVLRWLLRTAPQALHGRRMKKRLALVREAADSTPDPTARERFGEIARQVQEAIAAGRQRRPRFGFPGLPGFGPPGLPPGGRFAALLDLLAERGGPKAIAKAFSMINADENGHDLGQLLQICSQFGISPVEIMEILGGGRMRPAAKE